MMSRFHRPDLLMTGHTEDRTPLVELSRETPEVSERADGGGCSRVEDAQRSSQREKVRRSSRKRETSFQSTDSRGKLDVAEAELEPWDTRCVLRTDAGMGSEEERWGGWCCRPSCIPISIILVLIVLVVLLPLLDQKWDTERREESSLLAAQLNACHSSCRITLVESIPEGVEFPNSTSSGHPSTFSAWKNLLQVAERTVEIASFYWTLKRGDVVPDPSAEQGEEIFQSLLLAGTKRGLRIRIAQNYPTQWQPNVDTEILQKRGAAEVRSLNFPHLVGGGVLHTKFWLVDRKHFYVGSANMDWRSLTQVKEMGAAVYNCSCLASDIGKIFDVYWFLGQEGAQIPPKWPDQFSTPYGRDTPMNLTFNSSNTLTYLSSSPPSFCPKGRTVDLDAILDVIKHAEKFIYVAVMDYYPLTLYTPKIRFWPQIDDGLRTAAIEQKVKIRLLVSVWNQTRPSLPHFIKSLTDLTGAYPWVDIEAKYFRVPSTPSQAKIPFARVNHNKYMVTDNAAYIGTSNWAGDYFTNTGGVGFVIKDPIHNFLSNDKEDSADSTEGESNIRDQLEAVFERDWNSDYAHLNMEQ
ncbi:5'-3' exonuclease PLD3-like isoform X1 [Hetaerina americana]|uniref:5'-3' exonuclease PLD3-like isoform X1 n=2 Tax=Hetaerina americana TaxID=62018 RepID=UPI003A7F3330